MRYLFAFTLIVSLATVFYTTSSKSSKPVSYSDEPTHTIDYKRLFRSTSIYDGRWALLDSTTKIRLIGSFDGRHVILKENDPVYNLIDAYFEGKPVLVATPKQSNASCADIIIAEDVILLKKPISEDSLYKHKMAFAWPVRVQVLDYIDFGLPKGTECSLIGEEGDFWKVQLLRGEMAYTGFIPKELKGKNTLQKNCDFESEESDIREDLVGMTYPDWVEGTYEASGQGLSFTLKVFKQGPFLKADLKSYNPNFGWQTYNNIDCFYSPKTQAVSFPGIVNRCEIKMVDEVNFKAVASSFRFTGKRTD
ncbi:MAG: hypothetical protein AAF927_31290 [Bacteroidota bacterium]